MKKSILFAAIFFVNGCVTVTTSPEQSLLESGGQKLTSSEITDTFSGVKETYTAKDIPGLTAESTWSADGKISTDWKIGSKSGNIQGKWYVENDMRCIKHDEPLADGTVTECQAIYRTGDYYTSLNPDGSLHGIHRVNSTE